MLKNKTAIKKAAPKLIIAISMIIRVIMQLHLPIWARGTFVVDDYLMAQYADSINEIGWLGGYNYYTLNKLPGYAVFLAISDALGLPLMLSVGLFYCFACYIFLIAIRKFAKNEAVSLICYLLLLFSPAMFDDHVAQKIYRMAIVPPLIIIIVSSYLVLFIDRKRGIKKNLPWIIAACLSYAAFYLVREDSSWFLCFLFGAAFVIFVLYIIENRKSAKILDYGKQLLSLVSPLIAGTIAVNMLSFVNYRAYGVYAKNDFNETYFSNVCGLLMRIEPQEEIPMVYISRNTFERALEASPTLRQIQPAMERRYSDPSSTGNNNGEFHKAMFVWNFRWAAGEAGLYKDAVETNEFFKNVYLELSEGFENGTFEERDALVLSPWARPIRDGDMDDIVKYSFLGYHDIISYTDLEAVVYPATGPAGNLEVMEDVTNQDLLIGDDSYSVKGWMFALDSEKQISFKVYDKNGNEFNPAIKSSDDVYQYFAAKDCDYQQAKKCRFEFSLAGDSMDINNIYAQISVGENIIFDDLLQNLKRFESDEIRSSLDRCGYGASVSQTKLADAQRDVDKLNIIVKIYQKTWGLFAIAAAVVFIAELCVNIYNAVKKKQTNIAAWIIKLGLLLTIWGNLLVVSVNYFETDPNNYREYYAAGVYPIWHIFISLCICTMFAGVKYVFQNRIAKKSQPKTEENNA